MRPQKLTSLQHFEKYSISHKNSVMKAALYGGWKLKDSTFSWIVRVFQYFEVYFYIILNLEKKLTKSPICIYPDSPVVNILPNFLYYLCSHTYFLMFLLIFENKCELLCPFTPKILQCLFPKRENVLFFKWECSLLNHSTTFKIKILALT